MRKKVFFQMQSILKKISIAFFVILNSTKRKRLFDYEKNVFVLSFTGKYISSGCV